MNRLLPVIFTLLISSNCLWSQRTVQISESTNPSYHGYADGTATVRILGGIMAVEKDSILLSQPESGEIRSGQGTFQYVSTNDIKLPSIRIYPVPTYGVLNIRGLEGRTGTVEIFTILGQLVSRLDLQPSLNLGSLDKGVYYLRIRDRQGKEIETRRIVKK